jgi:hypothetical protein
MNRSTFLRLSAWGAAGLSIPFIQSCTSKPFNKALAQPFFLSHIFDAKAMKETGEAYLQQTPAENSTGKLVDALTVNAPITETTTAQVVNTYFDNAGREDFSSGKTVVVSGWILAITEARQCALFSLSQS